MTEATFATPGVSCMSCMAKIEGALTPIEGVSDVDVDLTEQKVRVTFDGASVDSDRLAGAISDAGYEVTAVSGP